MLKLATPTSPTSLATLKDSDRIIGKVTNPVAVALAEGAMFAAIIGDHAVATENRKLCLRRFQAATIAAFILGKHETIKTTIVEKRPAEWRLVKDAYSKAIKLANAINLATFPVPTPKANDRKRITLNGAICTTVGKGDLPSLANPQFGDTPVSTLISKVVEAEPATQTDASDEPTEVLSAEASEAFMLELRRRLADPVMFSELLPTFDAALVTHSDAVAARDVATQAERVAALAA